MHIRSEVQIVGKHVPMDPSSHGRVEQPASRWDGEAGADLLLQYHHQQHASAAAPPPAAATTNCCCCSCYYYDDDDYD